MRLVNFFDGAMSETVPTIGNISTTNIVTYPDDAAYEAANVGSPLKGNAYFNSTSNRFRIYNGTIWENYVTAASVDVFTNKTIDAEATGNNLTNIKNVNIKAGAGIDATKIADGSVSNAEYQRLAGVTSPIQSQLDQHTLDIADNTTDISNLQTLSGRPDGATDLGTFTGTTIPDNSDNKEAFQALETEVESKISSSEKGQPDGVATLDFSGKVPASQLPSYVDDVLEYANLAAFPVTGETGKIYIALDTNYQYRWSGSMYVQLASPGMSTSGVVTDNAITRYDNTTGLIVQASQSHLADDGSLKLGATTSPHASALMDLQSTTKGRLAPRMTQAQRDAISSPATGLEIFNTDTNKPNYYNGVVWTEVGSGSGSGSGIGFLSGDNSNFENTLGSWVAYQDAAGVDPVDGTGGSPTVTITRSTSSPLFGTANGLITKPASNVQGEGVSVLNDIDIDAYNGLPLKVSFLVDATNANIVSTDMRVYAYDVTNGSLLGAVRNSTDGYIQNRAYLFEGWVYPNTNTQSIRLIIHFASTSALAYTLKIDQVMMNLADNVSIPLIQKFDITPTINNFGTTTANDFKWTIIGNMLHCKAGFTSGTAAAAAAGIVLPFGWTHDSTITKIVGRWWYNRAVGASRKTGTLFITSAGTTINFGNDDYTTAVGPISAINANDVSGSTQVMWVEFSLPIQQLTTTTIDGISENVNAYRLKAVRATSSQAIASAAITTLIWNSVVNGNSADFNTTTGEWTCPKTGWYNFSASPQLSSITAAETVQLRISVNGVTQGSKIFSAIGTGNIEPFHAFGIFVLKGQIAIVTSDTTADASYSFDNNASSAFDIQEVPSAFTALASGPVFLGTEAWTHGEPNAAPAAVRVYKHGGSRRAIGVVAFTGVFVGTQFEITIPAMHAALQSAYGGSLIGTIRPMIDGSVTINDSGSGTKHLAFFTSSTVIRIAALGTSASYATTSNLTATIPHTWGSGDYIFFDLSWVTE